MQAGQEVDEPDPPAGYEYLLEWAWTLANRSGSNGFGRNPVTYVDIMAWAALTGAAPEPWEVGIIVDLDDAMMSESAKISRAG